MSGYTEACGVVESNSALIATKGINEPGQKGAYKGVFKASKGFKFDSVDAMKDEENWNLAVASGDLTYLGSGKFDDQSAEATFFEDTALNFRRKQTEATKVLGFQLLVCDCTNAELLKLDGQSGDLFFQTDSSFVVGRLQDDGKVGGLSADITVNLRSVPTDDTPAEYSRLVFSFTQPKADELNPCVAKTGFLFSEIDQVGRASYKVGAVSSSGANLTGAVTLYEDCTTELLTGVPQSAWKATDLNGADLTISSVNESNGTYTITVAGANGLAYVEFDGIKSIDSELYITDRIRLSTAS